MKATMTLLIALAVSACAKPGDFCVIYNDPIGPFAPETSAQIIKTDRPAAEDIAVRDEYFKENCE